MLLLTTASLAATCPPTDLEDLDAALTAVESALLELDERMAREQLVRLTSNVLPCLEVVVPPDQAVRTHRMMALHLYGLGETDGAMSSAMAAVRLAPDTPWPQGLLPDDHPLLAPSPPSGRVKKLAPPKVGYLAFDGQTSRVRPRDLPAVAQKLDAAGNATWTSYIGPSEPVPAYAIVPRRRNALLVCAGASAVAGVGTWVGSLVAKSSLKANGRTGTPDELAAQRRTAGALQGISLGLFTIGAGCTTGAVITELTH